MDQWQVRIQTGLAGTFGMDFPYGVPAIGGELNTHTGAGPWNTYTTDVYGSHRGNPWWVYNLPGRTDRVEIRNNAHTHLYQPSSGWSVGTVPTPLSATHKP